LKATETDDAPNKRVHIMYDHIPNELVPPKGVQRTKWIFLTAIGTSKTEVELYYETGSRGLGFVQMNVIINVTTL
jgi:hypothetical protein